VSTQLAVRLDEELIDGLDWLVARCSYASRTDAIRQAIRRALEEERRRQIDEQYAAAYARVPQSADDLAVVTGGDPFVNLEDAGELGEWIGSGMGSDAPG
jgi:Arc/MetJ-type ribon-helix-helix transcriptional regulator